MSNSRPHIALRLGRQVGGATGLLGSVMALPLGDGIFAAVVLSGRLSTLGGILQIGLLIFGGSATVAVILAVAAKTASARLGELLPRAAGRGPRGL